jgi:7-carboxy-7-deazaguanine synthase (Cx14CxxC type)
MSAQELAEQIAAAWPAASQVQGRPFVVCTGGEPLLQLDGAVIDALHSVGFEVAIETNGTLPAPDGIDWICVSPKDRENCILCSGDELKFVYPQSKCHPEQFEGMRFRHFFLQPMDGPRAQENIKLATEYCLLHPQWRLSLQIHKLLGLS